MKGSEILRALISAVFDNGSTETVSLGDALRLYAELVTIEANGAAAAAPAQTTENTPRETNPADEPLDQIQEKFSGYGAREKRATAERLDAFRERHGAGSFRKIAETSNGELTERDVADMTMRLKVPLPKWRMLAACLDELERADES